MPRLLSCYAKNKMEEEYLNKRQDKLYHEYSHVMRTHAELTSEIVKELIHIQIRTPSFETNSHSVPNSAVPRRDIHQTKKMCSKRFKNSNPSSETISSKWFALAQGKPTVTELHAREKAKNASLKAVVRGNKVYYQYDCPPKYWLKLVPNGHTRVLLHRCNAVRRIMERFPEHSPVSVVNTEGNTPTGQGQILAHAIDSKVDHENRDVDQGSNLDSNDIPGKLDGTTIINWCLWNREKTLPVWISARAASVPAKRTRGIYNLSGPSQTAL